MKLRDIRPQDNEQIAAIVRSNLEKYGLNVPGTAYFDPELDRLSEFYLADKRRCYLILEGDDGEVLGGVGIAEFIFIDDTAELQKIYLKDNVKGRGLGKQLIETIENKALELGYK